MVCVHKLRRPRFRSVSSDAYVVFSNDSGHWWSRFLHPTIRHCHIVVPDRGRWVRFSRTCESVELYADTEIDIGDTILVKAQVRPCKRNLLMLNTCVGFAKQVIGVNNPLILTPYQLYKHLEKIK